MEFTDLESLAEFNNAQLNNTGVILIKFGAIWCKPCQTAKPFIDDWSEIIKSQNKVTMYEVDVDVGLDIYHHLKSKKMVSGIPTILCYVRGNLTHIPDDSVVGASKHEIDCFFERCIKASKYL
jgi:thiol-disulfide isomerase/thioredoxin